jgi:tol-pal system protein YbgF
MIARGLKLTGAVLPLLLLGCVVEQRDFEALRDQVRLQQKQINDLKARQEEQALRLDTLNNGFKILGDKAEENGRRIDGIEERGAGLGAVPAPSPAPVPAASTPTPAVPAASAPDLPGVKPLPAEAAAPPPPAPAPVLLTNLPKAANPEPPPGGEVISAASKSEKLYAGALALFSNREYPQATAKFQEFVAEYPDHKLAGNAQYWIGECYYSQRRFAEAADEFAKVERLFPASPKVPGALYKRGLSLWEAKRTADAQAAMQRLLDKYAQSDEAAKAREKLERWKQP